MKPLTIHSQAIAELNSAIAYYENQRRGLGLELLNDVEQVIDKLQQNPNLGASYPVAELRRYIIQRFPFVIFYRELADCIWIVAIAHAKRKPNYWQKRQFESPN